MPEPTMHFDIENINNAIDEVETTPCHDINDFLRVRRILNEWKGHLKNLPKRLNAPTASIKKTAVEHIQGYFSKVEGALESINRRLQLFVEDQLEPVITENDGNCLYLSFAKQLNLSPDECRQKIIQHMKENKSKYQTAVESLMKYDEALQMKYKKFIEKIGETIVDNPHSTPEKKLREHGQFALEEYLKIKLKKEPEPFDYYCFWMTQDLSWGGAPEISAMSDLLERPVLIFRDSPKQGYLFNHIYNENHAGNPLILHQKQDHHFQPLHLKS